MLCVWGGGVRGGGGRTHMGAPQLCSGPTLGGFTALSLRRSALPALFFPPFSVNKTRSVGPLQHEIIALLSIPAPIPPSLFGGPIGRRTTETSPHCRLGSHAPWPWRGEVALATHPCVNA